MSSFIVAELSANHNHDLDTAIRTIRAAAAAGADAVKIQTYTPDTITLDSYCEDFIIKGGLWDGRRLYDLYAEAMTPWEWHDELFSVAKEEGIVCFSSPFDTTAVDFLASLSNPIYKIASFEITDIPLIQYAASQGRPMVISTGIATQEDITLSIEACHKVGNEDITLLKCTSAYPAPVSEINLKTMVDMRSRFGVKVGLSDHSLGSDVAVAAVVLGAELIEKHLILDRSMGGPDAAFSMNIDEFAAMVRSIRNVEQAMGKIDYPTDIRKIEGRRFARSLYVANDIAKGETISSQNVRSVRPSLGMAPRMLPSIIGRRVNRDLTVGEPMFDDYLMEE